LSPGCLQANAFLFSTSFPFGEVRIVLSVMRRSGRRQHL
jgi:hypothetical protein